MLFKQCVTSVSHDMILNIAHCCFYSLFKPSLEKEIVPEKCSFRVKKNRVTVTLWKKDKDEHWMSLTAKNPGKSAKPNASDPAAGIMEMMQVRYDFVRSATA